MFVDYAIEPYYYAHGTDFYKDGANYSLASLLTLVGPTILGQSAFAQLLAKFQFAVRAKTPSALAALVAAAQATRWQELPEALGPLALYASPDCLRAIATPGVTTDAAPIVLLTLINRMETMSGGPYRAEHDQSKNLLAYHQLFQRYIDHKEAKEFRIAELATMKFPLKLSAVTQVDSKTSPAVQLADILIGAVVEASYNLFKIRSTGLDPESVLSLYADDQFFHLAPHLDFEGQKRFHHGTQAAEMIDYIAKNFAGADLP